MTLANVGRITLTAMAEAEVCEYTMMTKHAADVNRDSKNATMLIQAKMGRITRDNKQ